MDTILDGELVVDVEPMSKKVCARLFDVHPRQTFTCLLQETLRYLAFDCLVFDNENVMSRSLDKRYGVYWCYISEYSR